jgi:GT2 family glycosyltransferase
VENGTAAFNQHNVSCWGYRVKLVLSADNIVFAGGNNLVLQQAKGNYIMLLCSNSYLIDESICRKFEYLEQHKEAGVVTAMLIYHDVKP